MAENQVLETVVFFVAAACLWQVLVTVLGVPQYLLPSPGAIVREAMLEYRLLARHGWVTLAEILAGFGLGATIGFIFAVAVIHLGFLERIVLPFAVFFQTIPKLAIAPLFLVWLGYGILPKIVVVVLMSVFPVLINSVSGLRSVDPRLFDLMNSLRATKWQVLWKVRLPTALPNIFAGLKISITLSVIGAVVGEWVGASAGLGFLILSANSQLNTVLLFAALATLSIIGILLFGILYAIERSVLYWHESIQTAGVI